MSGARSRTADGFSIGQFILFVFVVALIVVGGMQISRMIAATSHKAEREDEVEAVADEFHLELREATWSLWGGAVCPQETGKDAMVEYAALVTQLTAPPSPRLKLGPRVSPPTVTKVEFGDGHSVASYAAGCDDNSIVARVSYRVSSTDGEIVVDRRLEVPRP